ncbi:MAG TPA: hypothetical protein PKK06_05515 [Phycisphaerae bacterium]|nr:hypothetical protein [Phycisphaerae bacterium]HNU44784.1 hypothetical protein [Phycisphaerae bacterium]
MGQVLLECYLNGLFALLSREEAHQELHKRDFGWVSPFGWVRYGWEGQAWSGPISSRVPGAGQAFGFWLLTGEGARTLDRYRKHVAGMSLASVALFQAHASRFHRVLPEMLRRRSRLFRWAPVLDRNGCKIPAYAVVPERSTILIAGVDPDSCAPDTVFDWGILMSPPDLPPDAGAVVTA